ncbi:hypothetical protein DFH09DRAFT_1347558 [Mycena vulgaris]|nr:hypothetical protein DFH09DRAFT_1347558 [Mycena vulgaris]
MFLTQLKPETRLQVVAVSDVGRVVAVSDVGRVAALVLQDPERYIGKTFDWAGDHLIPKDFEDDWREVFGDEMSPKMLGGAALAWAVRTGMKKLRLMLKVFNGIAFDADIPALRAQSPDLKDLLSFHNCLAFHGREMSQLGFRRRWWGR